MIVIVRFRRIHGNILILHMLDIDVNNKCAHMQGVLTLYLNLGIV